MVRDSTGFDTIERMKPISVFFMLAGLAFGQLVDEFQPPKAGCCLQFRAQDLADQLQDWNQLGRYHADNQRLRQAPPVKGRVVFLGDSITDGWKLAQSFPGKPYVNRGISGQTTAQMLVRMFPDVINLQPEALIILAGTNDIARNTGMQTLEMIAQNFQAMAELAKAHGIRVVLCSVLPVSDYYRTATDRAPASGGHPEAQRLAQRLRGEARRNLRRLLLGQCGRTGLSQAGHQWRRAPPERCRVRTDGAGGGSGDPQSVDPIGELTQAPARISPMRACMRCTRSGCAAARFLVSPISSAKL